MDIWTSINTQLDYVAEPLDKLRLRFTILTWRTYDLASFGIHLYLLVTLFRHWDRPMEGFLYVVLYIFARSLLRPLAWLLLPNRPQYG